LRNDRPGQLIGTTRLPGGLFEIDGSEVGPLWAIHGNHGRMGVFTADGLFVASLFEDMRVWVCENPARIWRRGCREFPDGGEMTASLLRQPQICLFSC